MNQFSFFYHAFISKIIFVLELFFLQVKRIYIDQFQHLNIFIIYFTIDIISCYVVVF